MEKVFTHKMGTIEKGVFAFIFLFFLIFLLVLIYISRQFSTTEFIPIIIIFTIFLVVWFLYYLFTKKYNQNNYSIISIDGNFLIINNRKVDILKLEKITLAPSHEYTSQNESELLIVCSQLFPPQKYFPISNTLFIMRNLFSFIKNPEKDLYLPRWSRAEIENLINSIQKINGRVTVVRSP